MKPDGTTEILLRSGSALFLDFQTTGANPAKGNLLEVCWGVGEVGKFQKEDLSLQSFLVAQPEGEVLPRRITQLTGISSDDLIEAVGTASIKRYFKKKVCLGPPERWPLYCVIHFARFEQPFLDELFSREEFPFRVLCTHELARRIHPDLPSRGIRGLAGFYGESHQELKRSEAHVLATARIWHHLSLELAERGVHTVRELDDWIERTSCKISKKKSFSIAKEMRLALPSLPGVYHMISGSEEILYIGKATSLRNRVNSYFTGFKAKNSRIKEMLTQAKDIRTQITQTEVEAALLESDQIKMFQPPYNVALKNEKTYVFFDRQFKNFSPVEDSVFNLGPLSGDGFADVLRFVCHSFSGDVSRENLFWGLDDLDVLRRGIRVFMEGHSDDQTDWSSPRSILALGLAFLRSDQKSLPGDDDLKEGAESEEPITAKEHEDFVWTEAGVASAIRGVLKRLASEYRRSKKIKLLSNAVVAWKIIAKGRGWRCLVLYNGQITERSTIPNIRKLRGLAKAQQTPVSGSRQSFCVSSQTFDRLRILQTELSRLKKSGRRVEIISIQ